jgi:putative drug exporter of the RND superfamily
VLPSAMVLLGDRNWYLPRWLGWIPHLEVEGEVAPEPQPRSVVAGFAGVQQQAGKGDPR